MIARSLGNRAVHCVEEENMLNNAHVPFNVFS